MVCEANFSLPQQPEEVFVNGTIYCWSWDFGLPYWLNEEDYTCQEFDSSNCWCPQLKADPDVAGLGVILAFVISAGATLIATIVRLLLARTDGHQESEGWPIESQTRNAVDALLRRHVNRRLVSWLQSLKWNTDVLAACAYDLVLSLSDTQLITGIAVLVAAAIGISRNDNDGPMSVYHFTIITDLAWFSSNTHLLSLVVLRDGLESPDTLGSGKRRTWAARVPSALRIFLMLIMSGLLLYACWVSGFECWYENLSCPAKCTEKYTKGGEPRKWLIVNYVLILYSYPLHMLKLSLTARAFWLNYTQHHLLGKSSTGHLFSVKDFASFTRFCLFWAWNFMSSELFDVLELIVWFILGCYWVFQDRGLGHDEMTAEEAAAENRMGVGQLVPIVLLLLPLLALSESYAAHSGEQAKVCQCGCEDCSACDIPNRSCGGGSNAGDSIPLSKMAVTPGNLDQSAPRWKSSQRSGWRPHIEENLAQESR